MVGHSLFQVYSVSKLVVREQGAYAAEWELASWIASRPYETMCILYYDAEGTDRIRPTGYSVVGIGDSQTILVNWTLIAQMLKGSGKKFASLLHNHPSKMQGGNFRRAGLSERAMRRQAKKAHTEPDEERPDARCSYDDFVANQLFCELCAGLGIVPVDSLICSLSQRPEDGVTEQTLYSCRDGEMVRVEEVTGFARRPLNVRDVTSTNGLAALDLLDCEIDGSVPLYNPVSRFAEGVSLFRKRDGGKAGNRFLWEEYGEPLSGVIPEGRFAIAIESLTELGSTRAFSFAIPESGSQEAAAVYGLFDEALRSDAELLRIHYFTNGLCTDYRCDFLRSEERRKIFRTMFALCKCSAIGFDLYECRLMELETRVTRFFPDLYSSEKLFEPTFHLPASVSPRFWKDPRELGKGFEAKDGYDMFRIPRIEEDIPRVFTCYSKEEVRECRMA